ncbi:hypothetical protein MH117_24025 [Paenibacillus sp. ACRRX]|uniref:hypothetical protein n=1 Tax=Paenibacillus sp. ACRRX TaxID=2918206 RepID=UPI001EF55F0A|nr:hypothetical protein [Paenibacillus sp. ACRRX]MCG7410468.1 hypothetical protein [Paenibacillus sp. ACRRX]
MKNFKWMLAVLVMAGMCTISSREVAAANETPVKKQEQKRVEKKMAELNPKLAEMAKKSIRKIAGKEIELESVVIFDNTIFIYPKAGRDRGQVVIDQKSGKLSSVSIHLTPEEVKPEMKQQLLKGLQAVNSQQKYTIERISRTISYIGDSSLNGVIFTYVEGRNFSARFQDEKLAEVNVTYALSSVNPKVLQQAERTIKDTTGRTIKVDKVQRIKGVKKDVWLLESPYTLQGSLSITIGVQTGKVWSIFNSYNRSSGDAEANQKFKSALKEKEAIQYVEAFAQKGFGMDLKGYTAKRDTNIPGLFVYTKRGAPTLWSMVNIDKKIVSMDIITEDGIQK